MKLKTLYLTTLTLLILIAFPTIYVAGASSDNFTLSQGIYPQADCTIYRESNTYYAKNAYGAILYSGTNGTQIGNNGLDGLTAGRTWQETVKFVGQITLSGPLRISSYTKVIINGNITLANNADCNIIENKNPTTGNWYIDVIGGALSGNKGNQASGHGIYFKNTQRWRILNVRVMFCKNDGIRLSGTSGVLNGVGDIRGCYIFGNNGDGIHSEVYSADHIISDNNIGANLQDGMEFESGSNAHDISNNLIWNNGLSGVGYHGIYLFDASACTIDGNRIDNNGACGISVANGSRQNTITNNRIYDNSHQTGYHTTYDGIRIFYSSNNTCVGNWVSNILGAYQNWGINETGTSDFNLILGNSCLNCTAGGIAKIGANTEVHSCFNGTSWIT